uniref:Co-chaperonin GroES n=1 Tax=uncultured virus TaxID=340016 RepID=A0A221S3K1_9VIRU|nr:co-chaperonin GroES [uncultured virus]
MQAINNYVIIEPLKEEVKKEKGLLIMDQHVDDIRYLKAKIISAGNFTEGLKENDIIYYDRRAGHGIEYENKLYQVIRQSDVVLVA